MRRNFWNRRELRQDTPRLASHPPVTKKVLVQFLDSHDVYVLDPESGSMILVASPTAQANAFHAPLLADELLSVPRVHQTLGAVYQFSLARPQSGQASSVMLFDADRDGTIDSCSTLTPEQFSQAGFDQPTSWIK